MRLRLSQPQAGDWAWLAWAELGNTVQNGAKWGKPGSNRVKRDQTGANGTNRVNQEVKHYLLSLIPNPISPSLIPYHLSLILHFLSLNPYPLSLIPYP